MASHPEFDHSQFSTIIAVARFAVINYVMALLMLTIGNSQCLSIRVSQNALQTCKRLNKLISLLIFKSDEKKFVMGPS